MEKALRYLIKASERISRKFQVEFEEWSSDETYIGEALEVFRDEISRAKEDLREHSSKTVQQKGK